MKLTLSGVFLGSLIFCLTMKLGNDQIISVIFASLGLSLALLSTARFTLELYAKNAGKEIDGKD